MKKLLMCQTCLSFILWIIQVSCASVGHVCKITDKMAYCSHLKLTQIPSDLPINITALDISHNQLRTLPPTSLTKYNQLVYLNVGFNSISKLQAELCLCLPLLKILRLEHNQLHTLPDHIFTSCTNLRELNLGFNVLVIKNNLFKNLKNLTFLDVSHNHLSTARLGSEQQLENLQTLVISWNQITELKKDDLLFLNSSSLQRLDLSSNPLKEFHLGCFHAIGNLYGLVLDNIPLKHNGTKKLCSELSGTKIKILSLSKVQLSWISNVTFSGMNKTNLTILNLSDNDLTVIKNVSLIYFTNLKSLNLMNNNITHLFSHSLYGLYNLKYLSLENAGIRQTDSAFQWLTHLNYLIMDGNNFLEITSKTFKGLENLKNLSLSQCSIASITNKTFASLVNSSLEVLNLTKTGLSSIKPKAFSWLGQLKILDLGLNNIKQNLTGQEFEGLGNIETLYLSYNYQLTLTSESFISIPSLQKLRLRKIRCSNLAITPSPFRILKNLTILDLGNNNIANIKDDIFDGLHKLEVLDMQHNNLARLWKHTNPDGPVLFLRDLPKLRLLDLESNGFDEIPNKAFHGLSHLRSLNLGSNNLNLLPEFVFDDLTSLSFFSLQNNLITVVDEKVFGAVFKHLKGLNMDSNPFDCTCDSIAWFVNWLNNSKIIISNLNNFLCNTPSKYNGDKLAEFDISPCDSAPFKLVHVLCTTSVSLLIIMALLVHFEGWRIKFMWNVAVSRILGQRDIDRPQQQFEYDAYVIHAEKDKQWVAETFIRLEENNLPVIRFCLEERDFEAGISGFEAIINSIERSRKIIFIVTEHLLKDPWCKRFKVHHAIQQAIEQSRDSIILIFRQDIPDYKLKNALCLRRAMFKSHCILEWPIQKERLDAFYQELKSALQSSSRTI